MKLSYVSTFLGKGQLESLYGMGFLRKLDYRKQHSRKGLPPLHFGITALNFDPQKPQEFE
jgi:hypothetical protein